MKNSTKNASTSIGKNEVKEVIRSLVKEGKTEDELKQSITEEMLKLFNEGKVISPEAQEYLHKFKETYGENADTPIEQKETTETLKAEIAELVKDKKLNWTDKHNNDFEMATDYLNGIHESNEIFV